MAPLGKPTSSFRRVKRSSFAAQTMRPSDSSTIAAPASWPSQMRRIGKVRSGVGPAQETLERGGGAPEIPRRKKRQSAHRDSRPRVEVAVRRLAVGHDLFRGEARELEKRLVLPIAREVVLRKPSLLPRLLVEPGAGKRNGTIELLEVQRKAVREGERLFETLARLPGKTRESLE